MKPRKITRRVTVTAHEDMRDRLAVSVIVDEVPANAVPVHGDTRPTLAGQRAEKARRGGSNTKAPP